MPRYDCHHHLYGTPLTRSAAPKTVPPILISSVKTVLWLTIRRLVFRKTKHQHETIMGHPPKPTTTGNASFSNFILVPRYILHLRTTIVIATSAAQQSAQYSSSLLLQSSFFVSVAARFDYQQEKKDRQKKSTTRRSMCPCQLSPTHPRLRSVCLRVPPCLVAS